MFIKLLVTFSLMLFAGNTFAKDVSIGLTLGAPTGLSGKYSLKDSKFISAGLSGGYSYVDYQWYSETKVGIDNTKWYYGPGVVADKSLGVRGATGLEYLFSNPKFHAFSEVSFNVYVDDDVKTGIGVALGARYTF